jgi:hypothetical protein
MSQHRDAAERRREVAEWRASGLSATQYAARRGYSVSSLRQWAKDVSRRGEEEGAAAHFVQLKVATTRPAVTLEVGGARIVVEPGFDADHLRAVVAALASVAT